MGQISTLQAQISILREQKESALKLLELEKQSVLELKETLQKSDTEVTEARVEQELLRKLVSTR